MTRQRTLTLIGIAGLGLTSLVACGSDDAASSDTAVDAPPASVEDTIQATIADTLADTVADTVEVAPSPDPSAPPETDPPPTTAVDEPAEAAPGPGQLQLGLVDCVQFAMVAPVDAGAARSLVPDDVEVLLDEAGMATFTQVSKTCDEMTVDGASRGAGHFDTQWITIVGPTEQREYPDFAGYFVLPTDYLYPINFASDNDAVQAAVAAFGVPMEPADLQMDSLGPGVWAGAANGPAGEYTWSVDNATAGGANVYFVHVLERADDGLDYRYDIECPSTVAWGPGPASLEPAAGSTLFETFGAEVVGEGYGVELTCDVTIDRTIPVTVTEDVGYTETRQLDVYAPSMGSDWPVVVYFHGGNADPGTRKTVVEAAALAEQGVVVFVPSWRSGGPAGGSEDTVCAVAFAQATADEYGGDGERTTLSGYSTGGFTAAIHALIGDEPPLPPSDCLVDATMELPGAVVPGGAPFFAVDAARAGAFANNPQWSSLTPAQLDAFDPYLALGKNPDIRFVQVVGEDDRGGGALGDIPINESNLEYHDALVAAGYDADLVLLDGGHEMAPNTDRFETWVSTIAEAAHSVDDTVAVNAE
jgi:acetyl esterase/lipase